MEKTSIKMIRGSPAHRNSVQVAEKIFHVPMWSNQIRVTVVERIFLAMQLKSHEIMFGTLRCVGKATIRRMMGEKRIGQRGSDENESHSLPAHWCWRRLGITSHPRIQKHKLEKTWVQVMERALENRRRMGTSRKGTRRARFQKPKTRSGILFASRFRCSRSSCEIILFLHGSCQCGTFFLGERTAPATVFQTFGEFCTFCVLTICIQRTWKNTGKRKCTPSPEQARRNTG